MPTLSILLSITTLAILILLAVRLRSAIRGVRLDTLEIRNQLKSLATRQEALVLAVDESAAAGVNAACLNALTFKYPVFLGGPSIDAHHARNLIFLLQEHKPKAILELGSGSSSIIIARTLQLLNATPTTHISIDHEQRFLDNSRELARLNDLDHLIQFEHCPLQPLDGYPNPWYSRVPQIASNLKFDLVFVDGPPAYEYGKESARQPALEILRPFLASNAVIVLDDANRPGERSVIEQWQESYPEFGLHRYTEGKGMAVLALKP